MSDFSFLQEEYQALRREADAIVVELGAIEKQTLFAVSAALAWFATQPLKGPFLLAWFAPFVLAVFAMQRTWSIRRHQGMLSQYLARIEEAARAEPMLCMGWEHFQNSLHPWRRGALRAGRIGGGAKLYWCALAGGSLLFGVVGFAAQASPNFYRWLATVLGTT